MMRFLKTYVMPGITILMLLVLTSGNEHETAEAEFVIVERADVHQTIPIYGQLVYEGEEMITAAAPGIASQVCVKRGERVGAQAALIRLETPNGSDILSVYASAHERIEHAGMTIGIEALFSPAIRAERPCTIREVYIKEGDPVTAGMPLVRVSSHAQQIICTAAPEDAEKISAGMWAWLSAAGESLCVAAVEDVGDKKTDALTGLVVQEVILIPEKEIEMDEYALIDADVYLAGSDDVMSLPLNAITNRDTVWWVNDGRCTEIPAQIVLSDEKRAWVQLPEGLIVAVGEFYEGQHIKEACP